MPLIKTIAEVQQVMPDLVCNLNSNSLLANFDAIEEKYLVPLIGDELYEDLLDSYNSNSLDDDQLILVKHMRLLIAANGFLSKQAASHVFFTDAGIRVNDTGDMKKAVGWEYKVLKQYLIDQALDGTEVLLKYMWKKKAELPLWTESDAYKKFEGLLIRTGTDFNKQYTLYQPMRTFYALQSILADNQKRYIISGIGEDLLNYLKKLASPVKKENDIIDELKKGLAFFTIKHACEHLPIRVSDSGFTIISEFAGGDRETEDSGRASASAASIKKLMDACDRDGKRFIVHAKKLAVAFYAGAASAEYKAAYETGPLVKYVDPCKRKSGNERRKIFRF